MQIQGDYSYSNNTYEHKHTHHITKCLHEDAHGRQQPAAAGMKNDTLSMQSTRQEAEQEPLNLYETAKKITEGDKRGTSFLKGIWEAMGEETQQSSQKPSLSLGRRISVRAAAAVSSAVRLITPYGLINNLENVKEKIKAGTRKVLKRLGKKEEAFTALTDPKENFAGRKEGERRSDGHKEKGTRTKAESISTAGMQDSHLMDSYSKTGAYCRLNENLTYQKKGASEKQRTDMPKGEAGVKFYSD